MKYSLNRPPSLRGRWSNKRTLVLTAVALLCLALATTVWVRHSYFEKLKPVEGGNQSAQLVVVERGSTLTEIADQLEKVGLIRSAWAFKLYVGSKGARDGLQAGTYSLSRSQSVAQIVSQLSHGKVATDLVTIVPGQNLDQIRTTLINYGFEASQVDAALDPAVYPGHPALVDKPSSSGLEGYIYPDSYQKDASTKPERIIDQALDEMNERLTPELREAFASQGLSTYQAIILASIVEQEVSTQDDRKQAAQVFLKRLSIDMPLGSDVTAFYGARLAGKEPSVSYDSPYNTRLHRGLPPEPIGNLSVSSLNAIAHPAETDWLYFVSGDDGVTHFAHTLAEHEANTAKYCHKLCQ